MNSYLTPQSVHVVGQARQVQLILKQWLREWGPDAKLSDMLAGRKSFLLNAKPPYEI